MDKDFNHQLDDHLLARERAARGREEVAREPAALSAHAAWPGGDGLARGNRASRGAALLRVWFR